MAHGTNGDDTPQMYTGWDDVLTGDGELRWAIQETGITVPNNYDTVPVLNAWAAEDRWVRIEGYFKQSTPDTADGVFHTDFHQDTPRIDRLCSSDAVMTRYTSAYWAQWAFGTYASVDERSPTAVANAYLSNVYFDNTRQRLELGNASTYAACTRREVQPSTAWSDTSITALCQKGAIPTGTAYLFVVGADGTASAGIEVTVT
jgi:hypothetical protein